MLPKQGARDNELNLTQPSWKISFLGKEGDRQAPEGGKQPTILTNSDAPEMQ